jgi:CHAT domain-containing protein/tetratricopeptide (TPR) repeat protein
MNPSSVLGRSALRSRGALPLCVLLAVVLCGAKGTQPVQGPDLQEGLVVERDLAGGEAHVYPVDLQTGQFLRVKVQEKGIDLEVVLLDPRGALVTGSDSFGVGFKDSLEDLAAVAPVSGRYLLEVRLDNKAARPGRYRLEVATLQATAGGDEALESEAVKATWEGSHLPPGKSGDELLEHAVVLWERLGEQRKLAEVLFGLADRRFTRPDEYDNGAENYIRSAALWSGQTDAEAKSWQSQALNHAGTLLKGLGRTDEARKRYEEALAISGGPADVTNQASSLNNLGLLALDQGDTQRAVILLLRSADKARDAGDKSAQASALDSLGTAYLQMAVGQTALQRYKEALALARAASAVSLEAQIESDLGNTYGQLGELDDALEQLRHALEIYRRLGEHAPEARALINIGDAFQRLKRFAEARQSFDQSLAVARAIKDKETECFALSRQAGLFLTLNQPAKGLKPAEEALRLAAGFPSRELGAIYLLGMIHRDTGEIRQAREELDRALALARRKGERDFEADIDLSMAMLEQGQGNSTQALDHANAALEIVESIRNQVSDQRLRISFLATQQIFYEIYIDTLMTAGAMPDPNRVAAALAVSERARARSLLDILSESGTDLRAGADPALLEREHHLRDEVNARDALRFKLLAEDKPDRRELEETERKLEEELGEYRQVQADLKASSPAYAALTQPQPLSVAEIQAQILDGKALLLEYALAEKRSFLWVVTPDSVRSFQLPGRARIEGLARRYYELLTARNRRPAGESLEAWKRRIDGADADAEKVGRDLSRLLLSPVARLLGDRPLLIVADGALQYIPFAALPVSSPSVPLAARHEVVSLPSASALAVLRRDVRGRVRAPKALAIFADPVFQATDERLTHRSGKMETMKLASATRGSWNPAGEGRGGTERLTFRRLPSSDREAREIAALVPAAQRLLALGFDASRARALSPELAQYRDLHFATHGELDSRRPELSKLVLSLFDKKGNPEDGFLRLNDIYNLHLNADLVVLSACRTALGQEIRGEGLVGLTRGFMYAGAARVLASLWSVEDRATADLMTIFYRDRLSQGLYPAEALRRAQLEIAGQPGRKSPYFWAGFSLQGEWK